MRSRRARALRARGAPRRDVEEADHGTPCGHHREDGDGAGTGAQGLHGAGQHRAEPPRCFVEGRRSHGSACGEAQRARRQPALRTRPALGLTAQREQAGGHQGPASADPSAWDIHRLPLVSWAVVHDSGSRTAPVGRRVPKRDQRHDGRATTAPTGIHGRKAMPRRRTRRPGRRDLAARRRRGGQRPASAAATARRRAAAPGARGGTRRPGARSLEGVHEHGDDRRPLGDDDQQVCAHEADQGPVAAPRWATTRSVPRPHHAPRAVPLPSTVAVASMGPAARLRTGDWKNLAMAALSVTMRVIRRRRWRTRWRGPRRRRDHAEGDADRPQGRQVSRPERGGAKAAPTAGTR